MNILFVDDEPITRSMIEGTMKKLSPEWSMTFATNGTEALKALAEQKYDVIVSDMMMPDMDGATLLEQVSLQYPKLVRIIFSGKISREVSYRIVTLAHQFIAKPLEPLVLQKAILRGEKLLGIKTQPYVVETINNSRALPTSLKVFTELVAVLEDPEASATSIADVVKQDPAMSAKILQLVNSSFFVRRTEISDITTAVVRLGLKLMKELVLVAEIFSTPALKGNIGSFSVESLQRHSVQTANIAASLFSEKKSIENAFSAGLLHDVGKLLLAFDFKKQWMEAHRMVRLKKVPRQEAEREVFGCTHEEVSAHLLGLWGLPLSIVDAVLNHHEVIKIEKDENTKDETPRIFDLPVGVNIANQLAHNQPIHQDIIAAYEIGPQLANVRR